MAKQLKAIREDSGEEIKSGDVIKDFRDEDWIFVRATRANEPGRNGKVLVTYLESSQDREFYASVFGARVEYA